ncbi:hypothetical protein [Umezakia ovalisporum]|uniref:Uncharacterized protein n=1 Tax=Umezakia ovalisporum FSS-62 TaxID=2971776 RepID=A0AA43H040_9CYAN|nr:hypothetical protein [Umezakia ovalisporum]MDH6064659.1 hypothetical protein [Umezakia ovalisporum FSS-62]
MYIISRLGDILAMVVHVLGMVDSYPHTGARGDGSHVPEYPDTLPAF